MSKVGIMFEIYPRASPRIMLMAGPCLHAWTKFNTGLYFYYIIITMHL